MKASILLVDDDRNFLRVLSYHIEEFGFHVTPLSSGQEALEHLNEQKTDLVVTDLRMPGGMDGLELLKEIRRIDQEIPVIVLTAHGSIDKAVEAVKAGASDFLSKPFEKEEMRHAITKALRLSDLVKENRRLAQAVGREFEFGGFVGSSKIFRDVLEMAQQLTAVDTTVLIQGESGTGKELLARAIHFNGPRKNKPFVVVNCGAIPGDLMESELFGYRKGAFTGADTDRKGKFEAADSGTLLLDEVGELPSAMQVKLLRVLQEKEIDVVGDPHPRRVDVRILAATNRDLQELMQAGAFRSDLYYRLCVAPLVLPPLRRRRGDIPLLTHHFLRELRDKYGKEVIFDESAVEALERYEWPGNIRELENIVERLVIFDRRGRVTAGDLPAHLRHSTLSVGRLVIQLPEDGFSFEAMERDILVAALERHGWNQTRAARYLGMTRNTLIYRMQKFDIRQKSKGGAASSET